MSLITEQEGAYFWLLLGKWLNLQHISIELQTGFHCSIHNKRKRFGGEIRVLKMATGADVVEVNAWVRRGTEERNQKKDHEILSCAEKSVVLSLERKFNFAMETSPVKILITILHTTTNIIVIAARNDSLATHEKYKCMREAISRAVHPYCNQMGLIRWGACRIRELGVYIVFYSYFVLIPTYYSIGGT